MEQNENTLSVLKIAPGQHPQQVEIDNDLKALQQAVGGSIGASYTGTNFNRPGFNAILSEIEAGHVATLIVKDLSRFGRNYLQVGYYTEVVFPKKGVRFINIMNEWYAKDTSNKIKAVFKARMKKGMRCSGSIPYGYKRTKEDKQLLLVDEPAAEVVRKIYRLACQGIGVTAIAEQLSAEKVLIPSAYAARTPGSGFHRPVRGE